MIAFAIVCRTAQFSDGIFEKNGKVLHVSVEGRLIVNEIELSLRAVRDGLGLAYLLYDYIAADLKVGRLVPLLEDWSPRLSGFFLYHSSRRQITGPLQALITFLKADAARRGVTPAMPPSAGVYPTHRLAGKSRR